MGVREEDRDEGRRIWWGRLGHGNNLIARLTRLEGPLNHVLGTRALAP
jgi:hypothetical protein